jgi:hypothetical protein
MVAWIQDRLGRFPKRPHFTQTELDQECEAIVGRFLLDRHGEVQYPLSTEDLTVLVEGYCSDVDHYADLSGEGSDVEGMTEFLPNDAPKISISATLAGDPRRENRLRTTLAHELGHAHFHRPLFDERFHASSLFDIKRNDARTVCKRDTILGARESDWMEWQAGYVSGAILMPISALRQRLSAFCATKGLHAAVHTESPAARELESVITAAFKVSADAARIRLLKLNYLTNQYRSPSLFG